MLKEIMKRNNGDPFRALQQEMNRVFDRVSRGFFELAPTSWDAPEFIPRLDVAEDDREIRITADLPGLDEKDLDVSLSKDVLTIKGEKKAEREEQKDNYYCHERSFGSFQRCVELPAPVDATKIVASFKKGVLTVMLPKAPEAKQQVKKVAVKSE